jgi:hypothetical protein
LFKLDLFTYPLPSGYQLPGYGQQDEGGKAGNQQEHVGGGALKLG